MNKKDNIEFKVQETVVEEPAVQEEASLKEEAADMKEQAKKTIQLIKEKAKEEDTKDHPRRRFPDSRHGSTSDLALRTDGGLLYRLCCHQIPMPARHADY